MGHATSNARPTFQLTDGKCDVNAARLLVKAGASDSAKWTLQTRKLAVVKRRLSIRESPRCSGATKRRRRFLRLASHARRLSTLGAEPDA